MRLAELILRGILHGSPHTLPSRTRLKAAIEARTLLLRVGDPLVRYRIGAIELDLPLSHELPFYRKDHPQYSANIGQIAKRVAGPVIDIGANVGDTAAVIRSETDVPILCVEGDDRFFAILHRNAIQFDPPVELEHAFVGRPAVATVERGRGTARLVPGHGDEVNAKPLRQILREHPRFARPALVKIDTDGLDVPIILDELDLFAQLKPVLFFEYDPHLGADPAVFERLREIGYSTVDVYENTGEFVRTAKLTEDIHSAYVGYGGTRYADVCVMP